MKKFLFLVLISTVILSCKSDKKEQEVIKSNTTVYYLIRHAEKDRRTKTMDPQLTEAGLKRAENWSKIFNDIPYKLII